MFIDFNDPADPVVERVDYDFSKSGYALCIVDTGSSHGDLTDDYAAVTREMGAVAAHFGKSVLRDVPLEEFRAALPALRQECGDRAVLRAMHFYDDDRRAAREAAALKNGDFDFFLDTVNESGLSPWPWRRPSACWTRGPAGSTAAASRAPSRRGCPTAIWRSSRPGWKPCSAKTSATSCTSVPRADAWWPNKSGRELQ